MMLGAGLPRRARYEMIFSVVAASGRGPHSYLSTHCLHAVFDNRPELHAACTATELAPGVPREPSKCKHCDSGCLCWCHTALTS